MKEIIEHSKFIELLSNGSLKTTQDYLKYGKFLSNCYDNNIKINIIKIDNLNFTLMIEYHNMLKDFIYELLSDEIIYYGFYPIMFKTYDNDLINEYKLFSDLPFKIIKPFDKIEILFSAEYKINEHNYNKINNKRYLYTYKSKIDFEKIFKSSVIESNNLKVYESLNDLDSIDIQNYDLYKIDTKYLNLILHKKVQHQVI